MLRTGTPGRWRTARVARYLLSPLAAVAYLLLFGAAASQAHAILVRSDPAYPCAESIESGGPRRVRGDPRCLYGAILTESPSQIRLWFSEPVEPFAGGIDVRGPSGALAARGPVRRDGRELSVAVDATDPGTYVVGWRVVSVDTHPTRGSFAFSVGYGSAAPEPAVGSGDLGAVSPLGFVLQVISRWTHFAGFALGFGSVAFLVLVLTPLFVSEPASAQLVVLRLAAAGVVLLLVAEVLSLAAESTSLAAGAGFSPDLLADALGSSFGRVFAQRIAAALLLWTLLAVVRAGSARAVWAVLLVGVGLAVVDGEASHAGTGAPVWLGYLLNAAHVSAMAAWVGGIVSLIFVWAQPEIQGKRPAVLRRFARWARLLLAVLITTGIGMALAHLPHVESLRAAPYGMALTVKLGAVLLAIVAAFVATRSQFERLPRVWKVELGVLAVVLALAGLLVSLPPPR